MAIWDSLIGSANISIQLKVQLSLSLHLKKKPRLTEQRLTMESWA